MNESYGSDAAWLKTLVGYWRRRHLTAVDVLRSWVEALSALTTDSSTDVLTEAYLLGILAVCLSRSSLLAFCWVIYLFSDLQCLTSLCAICVLMIVARHTVVVNVSSLQVRDRRLQDHISKFRVVGRDLLHQFKALWTYTKLPSSQRNVLDPVSMICGDVFSDTSLQGAVLQSILSQSSECIVVKPKRELVRFTVPV